MRRSSFAEKTSFFDKLLTLLSWIGFIPTTKLRLWLFGTLQCLQFLTGLLCLSYLNIPNPLNEKPSRDALMYFAIDGTFYLNGLICFFINYQLVKKFPDVMSGYEMNETTAPSRKYLLIFVSTVGVITVINILVFNIQDAGTTTNQDKYWQVYLAVIIIHSSIIGISQCNVCSHLLLLGCIVSGYKKQSKNAKTYILITRTTLKHTLKMYSTATNPFKSLLALACL